MLLNRRNPDMPQSPNNSALLRPARTRLIVLSLLVALLIGMLPKPAGLLPFMPDILALVLIHWVIYQPERGGMTLAWILGLLVDVSHGSLFGQHAMVYMVVAFLTIQLRRRLLMFNLWQQALQLIPIFLASDGLNIVLHLFAGNAFVGWSFFLGSLTSALLWPLITNLLQLPQRRATVPDPE